MMHMGLHVVSLEGRLIHEARTYILRCYACFRTTTNVTKGKNYSSILYEMVVLSSLITSSILPKMWKSNFEKSGC